MEPYVIRNAAVPPLLTAASSTKGWVDGRLTLRVAGRDFVLHRDEDMEVLWERLGQDEFGADEHMPYWAELWPASLLLAAWLGARREEIAGRRCLELGCGMGLAALSGAACGARVTAVDYEEPAVAHGRRNARANGLRVDWAVMDWRRPSFVPGGFDLLWGGDILYESRFYAPLASLFRESLAPGGRIWLSQPWREVSHSVWDRLAGDGFAVARVHEESVALLGCRSTVSIYEISL